MLLTEFTYDFVQPFQYANSGQKVEAKTITVKAPNNKVLINVSILEEEYNKAQLKYMGAFKNVVGETTFSSMLEKGQVEETEPDKIELENKELKESEDKATHIITQMLTGEANMGKCYIALQEILKTGEKGHEVALIDGQIQVTKPIFESMHPYDTKMILGNYIANFILASPKA